MIGTKLGSYEIREEIGKGGMATVYRAYQPTVDRDVAIKIIHKSIYSSKDAIPRFQREARLIARLEHPHILPMYDFDGNHEPPYIVMRYLDSGTLKDVLKQGILPYEEITFLMRQIASALDYAHRQGIVHRDIKPSNILIDREGNAFVTDFGIARVNEAEKSGPITETGAIIGTPDYMSPEQARGLPDLDHRTDIYALGVMLFEMLTGQLPYRAPAVMDVLMQHMISDVPSILDCNPSLTPAIEAVNRRVLAKDPANRYHNANEFVTEVAGALGNPTTSFPMTLQKAAHDTIEIRRQLAARAERPSTDPGATPSEQQKQITVLYANFAEFMELAEKNSSDTLALRQNLWAAVDTIITAHGGYIDNHAGDTLLALWGVKSVRETDPEQAIRAALAIQEAAQYSTPASSGDDLPIQIGIHTGMTLLTRDSASGVYTASGQTVNMANRLEGAAPAGTVVISQETYNHVRGVFLVEGLEPVRFRGSKEAVQVYRVRGAKARVFQAMTPEVEGVITKTIGREAEIRLITELMETASEDRETQIVTIVGEAGVGKSRLLFEINEWEEKQVGDFWFFPVQCTPQMINQPFGMFRDLLTYRFTVQDSDDISTVQEKFERGVAGFLGDNSQEQTHFIAALFGFQFPNSPYLSNQDQQQINLLGQKYLIEFFLSADHAIIGTAGNPTLGVWLEVENIHWADDRSLDLINQMVEDHPHNRLVILCAARPALFERRPNWGAGQDSHTRVDLRPLSKRDSRKLVREILQKVPEVPDDLRDLIADRSEGNPFYMEELVKMLVEDRVIIKGEERWDIALDRLAQARVPATLTGLLQARLDSLLPEERIVLQRAAVIGRIFWDKGLLALQAADHVTADIQHTLDVLLRRELIYQREETAFEGTREYIFKSTLLRDVAYESILKRQQRNYHFEIANWLVEVAGERVLHYAPEIAEHYEIAGENILAAQHLYNAGERAIQVGAHHEASVVLEQGLTLIRGQLDPQTRALQCNYLLLLGDLNADQSREAAVSYFQEGLHLARELSNQEQVMQALRGLGQYYAIRGKFDEASTHLNECIQLARQFDHKRSLAHALMWLSASHYISNTQAANALVHLKEAVDLAQQIGDAPLTARSLNVTGETLRHLGQYEAAAEYYEKSYQVYRAINHQYGIALTTLNKGHVAMEQQHSTPAHTHYREAIKLALSLSVTSIVLEALSGLVEIERLEGRLEQAAELAGTVMAAEMFQQDQEVQNILNRIVVKVKDQLGADTFEAALERGKKRDWQHVSRELIV